MVLVWTVTIKMNIVGQCFGVSVTMFLLKKMTCTHLQKKKKSPDKQFKNVQDNTVVLEVVGR